jgi:3-isopropylmalate dehydrogenase
MVKEDGSYPEAAGMNIANPIATILSSSMMLKQLGLNEESNLIDYAVKESIKRGYLTKDLSQKNFVSTNELGDWIANKILEV